MPNDNTEEAGGGASYTVWLRSSLPPVPTAMMMEMMAGIQA